MSPTGTVIGGSIIITGLSVLKDVHAGKDPVKPVVTGFMLGGALLVLAFVSPRLAKALAVMGMVGAFMVNGAPALAVIGKVGQ